MLETRAIICCILAAILIGTSSVSSQHEDGNTDKHGGDTDHDEHGTNFADHDHAKEHVEEYGMDSANMSQSQQVVVIFREHDKDLDQRLDGIELFHTMSQHHDDKYPYNETEVALQVDSILGAADLNKDGYINFVEAVKYVEDSSKDNARKDEEVAASASQAKSA